MVFPAADALILTNNSITHNAAYDVQLEVTLAESRIRNAAGRGLYTIGYNATIIGNPPVDPRTHTDLPPMQVQFFQLFVTAGYTVSLDPATGYWLFVWSGKGVETMVQVYTFRTSLDPVAIINPTKIAIADFFSSLRPIVHSVVAYNGDFNEPAFGATASTFWEFTVVCNQQTPDNLSINLKNAVIQQGLGYQSDNCSVQRLIV